MAGNGGESFGIDINGLVSSIKDMMSHDLLTSSKCYIFKTPTILFRHKKEAYIPNAFSIGPLHYDDQNLKATEKIKVQYLQGLISRSPETMLTDLISSINDVEKEAREYYAEAIVYNPEELVKILVIDGCFLIELFRKYTYYWEVEEVDPILSKSCMLQFLYHDLILLENQVPWMVLQILFDKTSDSKHSKPLIELAIGFFESMYFSNTMPPRDQLIQIEDIKHFVDLFREISFLSRTDQPQPNQCINIQYCIKHFVDLLRKLSTSLSILCSKLSTLLSTLFRKSSAEEEIERWELLPSATSLMESGIKFKKATSFENILDVKFNDGVLEIPPFRIEETTETIFRNLISYEQCYPNCEHRITSYAVLLDSLINTAKDIDILCKYGIIENWLNPEEAAQLFNKLYHDTCVAYIYSELCGKVNRFCRRRLPRWRAVLMGKYFNTPWAGFSTLAAIILLIMTFLQTLYSMKK